MLIILFEQTQGDSILRPIYNPYLLWYKIVEEVFINHGHISCDIE